MIEVSSSNARNALFITHGFLTLKQGMEGTLKVFHRHQCVQSDPIEVAGRNADLTLQSRVADYRQEYLYDLLYKERRLFEYACKALSILPIEKYPIFKWMRTRLGEKHAPFFKEHRKETNLVLKMLEEGPLSSRDIKGWKKVDWWGRTNLSRVILERLWSSGKVMVHHREGGVKYYALTEDVMPSKIYFAKAPKDEECVKEIVKMIVWASRLVSPFKAAEQWYTIGKTRKVRGILEILEKEGDIFSLKLQNYKDKLYAPIEDREIWEDPQSSDLEYVRFLAPLDPLNWNRALFKAVYGMKYSWEVYKKVKDRKYGYYCLPILFNGNAVGLIEPFFKKKEKVLEIRSFHMLDKKADKKKFKSALEIELLRFSANLEAVVLEVNNGNEWLEDIRM
ncbi:MAG: DNA glycosylase AlkZ-like family protein [Candidatus Methanofastidiosia archaeon]